MPAYFDTGMFVRTPAWHGLGTVLETAPDNWSEARTAAGLDWEPIELPVFSGEPIVAEDGQPKMNYEKMQGWKRVVRSDTNATLAVAQDSYTLINHEEMGTIIDALLDQGSYHIDTAGSIKGGRQVWALMELGEPIQIPGDPSALRRYVAILNSHDGMASCKVVATTVRVVCANTWQAADYEAKEAGTYYAFTHQSGWKTKLDKIAGQARDAIKGAGESIERFRELSTEMIGMKVGTAQEKSFLDQFICEYKQERLLTARQLGNVNDARAKLTQTYYNSATTEGIRGNAYGLMQVGGEYADHLRPAKSVDTHVSRQLVTNNGMKSRAKKMALQAAAGELALK